MNHIRLACAACERGTIHGRAELTVRVQNVGMLRREREPPWELILELLPLAAAKMICEHCSSTGLAVDDEYDEEGEWEAARPCAVCGSPIPPERLEIFPDADRCAGCQDIEPAASQEEDFCPRCGAVLQVRARGRGVTRYVAYCPDCKR